MRLMFCLIIKSHGFIPSYESVGDTDNNENVKRAGNDEFHSSSNGYINVLIISVYDMYSPTMWVWATVCGDFRYSSRVDLVSEETEERC